MPGILVGIDGSRHSQRALEWAVREAGLRHAPLTVLTVHQAVAGHDGGMSGHTGDPGPDEYAREAAQVDTDKALAGLDGPQPESVTVTAIHSFSAGEIARAGRDADIIVLGSRGAGGFTQLMIGVGG
jgi:nucleotide-binding universal stress UspA family protein